MSNVQNKAVSTDECSRQSRSVMYRNKPWQVNSLLYTIQQKGYIFCIKTCASDEHTRIQKHTHARKRRQTSACARTHTPAHNTKTHHSFENVTDMKFPLQVFTTQSSLTQSADHLVTIRSYLDIPTCTKLTSRDQPDEIQRSCTHADCDQIIWKIPHFLRKSRIPVLEYTK